MYFLCSELWAEAESKLTDKFFYYYFNYVHHNLLSVPES